MSHSELIRRRALPHWDVPHAAYFVTSCLEGSIPARGLLDVENYRIDLERRPRPKDMTQHDWQRECWKRLFARRDRWLDEEPAVRHLEDPRLAKIVVDALYYFAGKRYDLLAFVVMPSHLHWVFQPRESWVESLGPAVEAQTPRERVVHSINRHIAYECNQVLGKQGPFWQHEAYDHWVRDVDELERIMDYIENNPVKAGLVESPQAWLYSSAHDRHRLRLERGEPLCR
jgi:REP-associated tyrosine transposase